jgi:uncharacterized lipoprotein YbaY
MFKKNYYLAFFIIVLLSACASTSKNTIATKDNGTTDDKILLKGVVGYSNSPSIKQPFWVEIELLELNDNAKVERSIVKMMIEEATLLPVPYQLYVDKLKLSTNKNYGLKARIIVNSDTIVAESALYAYTLKGQNFNITVQPLATPKRHIW